MKSKIKYTKTDESSYDSGKILNYTQDEVGVCGSPIYPIGKTFRIGKFFYLYYKKGFFWFRFFDGYGIWGRNRKSKEDFELFSERNGYTKFLKVFGWKFKILKP
jgi:hypothetical protein